MINSKKLGEYCKKMLLNFRITDSDTLVLIPDNLEYEIIGDKDLLFDEDFNFSPTPNFDSDGAVYEFCGHWYLQVWDEDVTMKPLKYVGSAAQKIKTNHFLGIHSGNELLNGVGLYGDWIKKAVFLGIKTLGISEKNNVGGSMEFQKKCLSEGIKPIIGVSLDVKDGQDFYSIKCYAKDFQGWQNLLKFTYKINVENEPCVERLFVEDNSEGLFIIIDPKSCNFKDYSSLTEYYQLDTVIFSEEGKDIEYTNNLERFLTSNMKPVLLGDAYCIEKEDWAVREKLWGIAKSFDYRSKNQYFKSNDEIAVELIKMFEKGNNSWLKIFKEAESNLNFIVDNCKFQIDTTSRHLPKYKMTKEESSTFSNNEQLFMHFIKKGFVERGIKKSLQKQYVERLKKEIDVLKKGNVIDYFLITRDIINFAKSRGILVGIGRGSAGGSLVSYLLGIIQIDPIEFELIFERFLNEGRMGSLKECDAYLIETSTGNIKLNEKSVLKINRSGKEINIFIEELSLGDEIISY